MRCCFVTLLIVAITYAALPLPPYLKPCAREDPNFNECALQHGKEAVSSLVKGDKTYKIPNLNPITIREIKVTQGPRQAGFTLTVNDVKIYGVDRATVEKTNFDFNKKHISIGLKMPKLFIIGQYNIAGRVLILPINGHGIANITLVDNDLDFSLDYTLEEFDGKTHLVVKHPTAVLEPKRVQIYLSNLFNGDKLLETQMNAFMNENWQDVYREMAPAISDSIAKIVGNVVNSISSMLRTTACSPRNSHENCDEPVNEANSILNT